MLAFFFRIVALVRKELLAMLKDPRGRAVLFVPPALQCLVFGYAVNYDLNRVAYAAYDRDRSAASSELLASLDGSGVFHRVANLDRMAQVKSMIDDRRVLLVIQIDQDFERRLLAGESASVQAIADGRNSNTAGTALNYVGTIVDSFNAQWWAAHGGAGPPVTVTSRSWYNWNLETRRSILPSLVGTLTLAEILLMTAMSIAREKEEGTFDQLLVTPFRPAEIMIGKAVPSLLVGLSQSTVILLVAQLWFHSIRGLVPYPLRGPHLISSCGMRDWTSSLVAGRDHAAGVAGLFHGGDAVHALVRTVHLDQQHARGIAGFQCDQPAALYDRHIAPGLSGRCRPGSANV
jgi:ABC-2 type transport system permease protein